MNFNQYHANLLCAIEAALQAGTEILAVYETAFEVEHKADHSPLTQADKAANNVITAILDQTGIPVLSEEGKHIEYSARKNWPALWVVDPLDGTREFVKRNGEFTVNIALVEQNYPVIGVIYVPVTRLLYYAVKKQGVYKYEVPEGFTGSGADLVNAAAALYSGHPNNDLCRIVASRSHMSPETEDYIAQKKRQYNRVELVSRGSSLKFCLIAENLADVYPRYAPTMEWDTAAGQVIVEEYGKTLVDCRTGARMKYNREQLLNNWFLVE